MLWLTSIYFLCRLFERTERGGKTGNNLGDFCGNKSSNLKLVKDEEDTVKQSYFYQSSLG